MIERRDLLKGAGAFALAPGAAKAEEPPRNVIFMVSDGMSAGVLPLAERFSRIVRGRGTKWAELMTRPGVVHGLVDTASLSSPVTDSAAAASAWGSGTRVFNASINVLPDGTRLAPIAQLARDRGKRVGLATTATVTHATPAGFAAVEPRRDDEHLIALQYSDTADVILGGGVKFFDAAARKDRRDVIADYRGQRYHVVRTRRELLAAKRPERLLGLFSDSHVPYAVDCRGDAELQAATPSLSEMTQAALDSLSAGSKGFLLQVEGGRIDHAAHANDAAALVWEQLAFDDAVAAALAFAERRRDTLVVITTDHGNSNPGLVGMGQEYRESGRCFERLAKATCSFATLGARLSKAAKSGGLNAGGAIEMVREATGVTIGETEAKAISEAAAGRRRQSLSAQFHNLDGILGQALSNYNGIGWTGTSHTADFAIVTAIGPGASLFAGLTRNTDAFEVLAGSFGIKHRNPKMDPAKASRYASLVRPSAPHWV